MIFFISDVKLMIREIAENIHSKKQFDFVYFDLYNRSIEQKPCNNICLFHSTQTELEEFCKLVMRFYNVQKTFQCMLYLKLKLKLNKQKNISYYHYKTLNEIIWSGNNIQEEINNLLKEFKK